MIKFEVTELKGIKSYWALQVFHTMMLGLKMLPAYIGESYEEFFARVEQMPTEDQEKMIREAALFVKPTQEEIESLICFVKDPNGVPYSAANLRSLGPDEIFEAIVAVCTEVSKIKIDFVTPAEKKN